jgi:hypothetical protein
MKGIETASSGHEASCPQRQHRETRYHKVCDNRKREVRGLWKRNDRFYARMTVEDHQTGRKAVRWIPLGKHITTSPQAIEELKALQIGRLDGNLRPIGQTPTFDAYVTAYDQRLEHSGKKPRTMVSWLELTEQQRESCPRGDIGSGFLPSNERFDIFLGPGRVLIRGTSKDTNPAWENARAVPNH